MRISGKKWSLDHGDGYRCPGSFSLGHRYPSPYSKRQGPESRQARTAAAGGGELSALSPKLVNRCCYGGRALVTDDREAEEKEDS